MSNNNSGGIGIVSIIIFSIMAYFVYGKSIDAMLGMVLLTLGSGFTVTASIIPVIGAYISWHFNTYYTYPMIMNYVGLTPTWLTTVLFIFHTAVGILITIYTTIRTILRIFGAE